MLFTTAYTSLHPEPIAFVPTVVDQLTQNLKIIVCFGPKGTKPRVICTSHAVIPQQRLKIKGEPVRKWHGLITVWIKGLLRLIWVWVGGLRESVHEVVVGIEGGVVVPNGRHDGYVAVVRGVVRAGYAS